MISLNAALPPSVDYGVTGRDYQVFRRLVIAPLIVACAGPLALTVADRDLWSHALFGEDWINRENLAELTLAQDFRAMGVNGMLAAKVLLGMTTLLMWLAAWRQGVRATTVWALLLPGQRSVAPAIRAAGAAFCLRSSVAPGCQMARITAAEDGVCYA